MTATCTIAGCHKPHLARGYCGTHYRRWRVHGDPEVCLEKRRTDVIDYFYAHLDDVTDECMIWPYGRTGGPTGVYGLVYIDGKPRRTHVLACEHRWGPMPEPGMHAAHGRE